MTQMLEGSTLLLILALAALAVMIAVCTVLLAPYTCGRALLRLARKPGRAELAAAPRRPQLSPRFP